jgi:predicted esterase
MRAPPRCCCTAAAAARRYARAARVRPARHRVSGAAGAGHSWYPYSFLAPLEQNEPHLSDALAIVGATLERARAEDCAERVALIGFSQGGCLALEYARATRSATAQSRA